MRRGGNGGGEGKPAMLGPILIGGGVFLAGCILATLAVGALIVKLRPDHFCGKGPAHPKFANRPALRWAVKAAKNMAGVLLILAGLVLSLPGIPGPGLLVVFFGLTLLDFPGKRRAEAWLIGRKRILRTVNWLRRRFHRPPMIFDCLQPSAQASSGR